jgi:serine/threonine protein kinase
MKTMKSPYIINLYDVEEDENNIYLLLEYCDGGDLINYQAKLKDRVFTLEKATEVLSEVIIGLEQLHQEGYLHRDIKSQNVLIKTENGKEVIIILFRDLSLLILGSVKRKLKLVALFLVLNNLCPLKYLLEINKASMVLRLICGHLEYFFTSCSTWNSLSVLHHLSRTKPPLDS